MTDTIQAWTDTDLAVRAVLLKTLADLVNAEFRTVKALAAEQFPKGASIPARTAKDQGDVKLGKLSKSDPKPTAQVTNIAEFEGWLRHKFSDKLEPRVILGEPSEICAVLQDHGHDDLYSIEEVIPDWLRNEWVTKAAGGEKVPGVTVSTPDGVVQARAEAAAKALVVELLSASPVPLLALEGGAA
jgi:hypothetical protein